MGVNAKRTIVLSMYLMTVLAVNANTIIPGKIQPVGTAQGAILRDSSKVKLHLSKEEVVETAKEAYIYGLPLVFTDLTRQVSGTKSNVFTHAHKFFDYKNHWVVAPNNDTNYSTAFLDLGQDAIVLTIPDTKGRYFVVPLMDAWTNVFASFGKRNTGTKAQKYLITGPKWKGIVPSGLKQVKSATDMV